ncbi:Similar to AIG2-like protein; acc. no. Q9FIX2 [Pyronema omphalodes CBS 100304]|uniref:Putative gamma-glutamylcyclotransferase n=1 Tax=Pyronema omphalodes (strain CBS 100304) TaxID=1076935 RepID=U4L8Q6_PYROM|nr:Similar to AIG2-like protein; acc. no. Q9FIX2 [Pyronema omphalodes CBS 100304]
MAPEVLYRVIYGTNTPEKWQKANLKIVPAILHGYCRHQVQYADYPGIIAEDGKSVKGTYVTGLNGQDVRRLDLFEGTEYERIVVTANLIKSDGTDGKEVQAHSYIYKNEAGLVKQEWNFDEFVKDKMHRWTGSDDGEYQESDSLSNGEERVDPTGGRRNFGHTSSDSSNDVVEEELKAAV